MHRLIFIALISVNAFSSDKPLAGTSKELRVQFQHFRYNLKYSSSELLLKGEGIELGLKGEPCNQNLVKETFNRIETQMKLPFLPILPKNGIKITQGGNVYFDQKDTKRGFFFLGLPSLFKQLVIEELLLCKK